MNAREEIINLVVDYRQLTETITALCHTVLLHRVLGKFNYDNEIKYTLGSVGVQEVDCKTIDLTYVKVNSNKLTDTVNYRVANFVEGISEKMISKPNEPVRSHSSASINDQAPVGSVFKKNPDGSVAIIACIFLEFFQRKSKAPAGLKNDNGFTWESWKFEVEVISVSGADKFAEMKESLGEQISEKILYICSKINRSQYLPSIPKFQEISNVFDHTYPDCEPYLFTIRNGEPTPIPRNGQMMLNVESSASLKTNFEKLCKYFF
uniref:Autophagy-related protein 101 n=1 Tax=Rhabditophanes sp. KR3021 TaxID=114890 RepID=A0AC35U5W9_9BILA